MPPILILYFSFINNLPFLACSMLVAILFLAAVIYMRRFNKIIHRYKKHIDSYKNQLNYFRINAIEERQSLSLHREELLSQAEHLQELNFELEKLSLVASKTDTAVIIADNKGRFTWVNQGFVKLFGYSMGELINEVGKDIFSVSNEMNIKPMLERAVANKVSLNYTSMMVTKSGENKWVKTTMNPVYDEKNKITHYIILQTDVSELKLINDKLKKLSLVASKTSNSVIIFNSDSEMDWVNEGFHKMYGYSRNEFTDQFGTHLKAFLEADKQTEVYKDLVKKRITVSYVSAFKDRFGILKWKQSTITPIYSEQEMLTNYIVVESDITQIKEAEHKIQEQKEKVDELLLNILPAETAEELKSKGKATPRLYRSVSVLFADIVDFTKLAQNLTPEELVHELQTYFSRFDDVVTKNFVEKIKTIGDAFMCVGGIPIKNKSHPFDSVLVGLHLQRIIKELSKEREEKGLRAWQLRIGIHSGPVVAGVVGKQKMTYDIWGDTVNIAKRIESACVPGMVNISATTYEIIKDFFECEHRGNIMVKHNMYIQMYFVFRIKPEFSVNNDGITPNNYFKEMLSRL